MSKDFGCQITLTPVIYSILREKAKSKRYSARAYLDVLLHEVFSEEFKKREPIGVLEVSLEEHIKNLKDPDDNEDPFNF
jgi:hypothetical protein